MGLFYGFTSVDHLKLDVEFRELLSLHVSWEIFAPDYHALLLLLPSKRQTNSGPTPDQAWSLFKVFSIYTE